jgi:hypothetical protein
LPERLALKPAFSKPRARRVATLQCRCQPNGLLRRRHQFEGGNEFHGSGALLRFDVAPHYAFGHGANRSGVVAAVPQRGQTGPERGEFLPQHTAGSPLKRLTISATDKVGPASTNRCTWSGITSTVCTVMSCSVATSLISSLSRSSIGETSTLRRYFGHQTRWYLRLNTAPALGLYRD